MSARHFMNPAHGSHMGAKPHDVPAEVAGDVGAAGQHHAPSIHIHSHSKGHTVHILHSDGRHEKHEHAHGDSEGMAAHLHQHLGGENQEGQDHGYSAGEEQENETGYGPGV